jgi:hypothetical protein
MTTDTEAILNYQGAGSFDGTSLTDDHRCVMVWEKHAGEWQLVMEQCSFSSQPGQPAEAD